MNFDNTNVFLKFRFSVLDNGRPGLKKYFWFIFILCIWVLFQNVGMYSTCLLLLEVRKGWRIPCQRSYDRSARELTPGSLQKQGMLAAPLTKGSFSSFTALVLLSIKCGDSISFHDVITSWLTGTLQWTQWTPKYWHLPHSIEFTTVNRDV